MERPFNVNTWDYAEAKDSYAYYLIIPLLEAYEYYAVEKILKYHKLFGGKGLGLALCESLWGCGWHVPYWFGIPEEFYPEGKLPQGWLAEKTRGYAEHQSWRQWIVRSSEKDEDWFDSRAGVQTSTVCNSEQLSQIIEEKMQKGERVIVQVHQCGMPCVIDVGYSELLQKTVVRLAYGNQTENHGITTWTSPTWDQQSHFIVFDAETMEVVCGRHTLFTNSLVGRLRAMVDALKKCHIDFGVQLEAVIACPTIAETCLWSLVQIRPSPQKIQGMKERPHLEGKLLATTASVNQPGDVSAEVISMHRDSPWGSKARQEVYEDEDPEPIFADKILLWDSQELPSYGHTAELIHWAVQRGAVGHLTSYFLFVNSAHGSFLPFSRFPNLYTHWEQAIGSGVQLSRVDDSAVYALQSRIHQGEQVRLRLVSDGLVGQMYELE